MLRVNFLNPEVLTGWGLTTTTIIEWANGTKDIGGWAEVMMFQETPKMDKADIRVQFSGNRYSALFYMCIIV